MSRRRQRSLLLLFLLGSNISVILSLGSAPSSYGRGKRESVIIATRSSSSCTSLLGSRNSRISTTTILHASSNDRSNSIEVVRMGAPEDEDEDEDSLFRSSSNGMTQHSLQTKLKSFEVEQFDDEIEANLEISAAALSVAMATLLMVGITMAAHPDAVVAAIDPSESSRMSADGSVLLSVSAVSPPTANGAGAGVDWSAIFQKASRKALGGGKAGASAAAVQVMSLMWLRTAMNYQYRYGGNLQSSLSTLWSQGGVGRLYQGLPFALVQGPLTRFGDTAANVGILALLEGLEETRDWPVALKTACGSVAAGLWRIFLMPIDSSKTALQVEGREGLERLWGQVLGTSTAVTADDDVSATTTTTGFNPGVLYRGAFASAAATAVGHFPWFATYNALNEQLPMPSKDASLILGLARSAVLGLSASCVSDCCSNSLRVIKTTKQTAGLGRQEQDKKVDEVSQDSAATTKSETATAKAELSYIDVVTLIIEKDGVVGLFGRGLQTRLLTNAIQGAAFSVLWKYFQGMNG